MKIIYIYIRKNKENILKFTNSIETSEGLKIHKY